MGGTIAVIGMVLSAMPIGEYDKRLVILTRERGKISVFAKGARRINSSFMAGSRPFSFGEFELYEGRSSYTVSSMCISNYFEDLSSDVMGALYGFYFLELAEYFTANQARGEIVIVVEGYLGSVPKKVHTNKYRQTT